MKRVLFVDDEMPVLEGLRVRLRAMRGRWQMEFVDSGRCALEILERQSFDVIVSDMRMPEMDGAQLLRIVCERWPHTVRIVLSGFAELDLTVRLAPLAHQYLSKPCDPNTLENVIERCLALQRVLQQPALRGVVGQLRRLPPIPETYAKLQAAMAVETVAVHDVALIVAGDTVIAAKLLQMVNSAFFRLPRPIRDIGQAVTYLGLATVRNLVASTEVFAKWPATGGSRSLHFARLQSHSVSVAAAAHALSAGTPCAADALLAAMLHDIGYWVLAQERGPALDEAVQLAAAERVPLDEAERRVLGASHAEIGAYLLGLWGFPMSIVEAIAHHHDPRCVPQTGFDVLATLSIAHALAQPPETAAFDGAPRLQPEIDAGYLQSIKAPFDWAEATRRVTASQAPGARIA